jgi:penicillin-binding protein 1A
MASDASSRSPLKRWTIGALKITFYSSLLALVALVVAVAVAMSELPDYSELVNRNNLGQMIRVHAADGIGAGRSGAELRRLAPI